MNIAKLQSIVQCPYCRKRLKFSYTDADGLWGVAACGCDKYPVIDGILYLKKDDRMTNRRVLEILKTGDKSLAWRTCFSGEARRHRVLLRFCRMAFGSGDARGYARALSLFALVGPSRQWFRYLQHHFTDPAFSFASRKIASAPAGSVIADIGCGTCDLEVQASIKRRNKPLQFVAMDKNFLGLALARMQLTPNPGTMLICCDVENGIPLADSSINTIWLVDTFSFVYAKERFVDEVRRALASPGTLYLMKLPLPPQTSWSWGYPIPVQDVVHILKTRFSRVSYFGLAKKMGEVLPVRPAKRHAYYSCIAEKQS